jgi:hypothetical protein
MATGTSFTTFTPPLSPDLSREFHTDNPSLQAGTGNDKKTARKGRRI